MAGFTDLFLTVQHRSDKFTYLDSCEAYIAEKAETNKEPVVIEKAKFGISIREERLDALQAFIYNDQEHPAQTVFYFHGGAYINQPNAQQTTMAGILQLKNGAPALVDGVSQLKNVAMQLSDGLKKFNEEGVQKIIELVDNDMKGIVTRLKATIDVSKNYRNFSGISDDMGGQVKFIYRTEEIKSK